MNRIASKARQLVLAHAWLLLLAVWAVHMVSVHAWFGQTVLSTHTLHNNSMTQAVCAMVLTGRSRLERPFLDATCHLPPTDAGSGATATVASAFGSEYQSTQYRTTVPLFTLLSSVPAVVLGIEPRTLQVGAVLPLGLLMLVIYAVARRFTTSPAAAAAAILLTLLPATIGAMRTTYPYLGLMLGPATAIAALLATDRFRRLAWVVPAALLTTLATRWGESAADALKALFAISGVVAVLGGSLLLRGTERSSRGLIGLGLYLLLVFATVDVGWLVEQSQAMVTPQATHGDSTPLLLLPLVAIRTFLGYLWLCRGLYLGWPAAIVVGAGAVSLASAWRRADVDRRIHIAAIAVWFVAPLLVLSLSEKRHADYMIGALPPLAVVAAVGLREVRRVGAFLPWIAVVVLVPSYVALSSPGLLGSEAWRSRAPVRIGMSVETCNPVLTPDPWHGIIESPLVTYTDHQADLAPAALHTVKALQWACEGEGAAALGAMERGAVVLAVTTGYGLFDWIGADLQACHPHVVVRRSPTTRPGSNATSTRDGDGPYIERWERVYVATFREVSFDHELVAAAPQRPPSRLGEAVEVARSEEIALFRIVPPSAVAVHLADDSR